MTVDGGVVGIDVDAGGIRIAARRAGNAVGCTDALRQRRSRYAQRRGRQRGGREKPRFSTLHGDAREQPIDRNVRQFKARNTTSMARPLPAPHSITVSPSGSVAIPARRNLQIASTTIVSAIAVSVAKANAVVFCQELMSPGHRMDSITDQLVNLVIVASGTFSEGRSG